MYNFKTLKNIGKVFSGSSAPQDTKYFKNGTVPFVRTKDLATFGRTNNLYKINDYINQECINSNNLVLARKGTVLFPKSGASIGNNNRAMLAKDAYIVSHLGAFYSDNFTTNRYVYYYFCSINLLDYCNNESYPSLKISTVQNIKIPFPIESKQKQIADTLDKANELIELRKESIKKLDELIKSVFIDIFGDPIENPKEWNNKTLLEVCKFENGDRSSKYPTKDDLVEDGIIFLSSREIVDFEFRPSKSQFITEKKFLSLSQGHCYEGDIIFTLRGNGLGKCCIFKGFKKGFINAQMVILRFDNTFIRNDFFISLIKSESMFKNLLKYKSGSAQPQLAVSELKKLNIIIPPIELQNQFAKKIEKIEQQKTLYEKQLEKLQYNFDALLAKSFEE